LWKGNGLLWNKIQEGGREMKFVWILTKEIEYQWTTYHFIHSVYESRELADKAVSERVKLYGSNEDDYEIIKMPIIQEEKK